MQSYCIANNISTYEHMTKNDYRQNMFSHSKTRDTWKYVRKCFSKKVTRGIDKYLFEKYPDEFKEIIYKKIDA